MDISFEFSIQTTSLLASIVFALHYMPLGGIIGATLREITIAITRVMRKPSQENKELRSFVIGYELVILAIAGCISLAVRVSGLAEWHIVILSFVAFIYLLKSARYCETSTRRSIFEASSNSPPIRKKVYRKYLPNWGYFHSPYA